VKVADGKGVGLDFVGCGVLGGVGEKVGVRLGSEVVSSARGVVVAVSSPPVVFCRDRYARKIAALSATANSRVARATRINFLLLLAFCGG
jgi:hypothetical protein